MGQFRMALFGAASALFTCGSVAPVQGAVISSPSSLNLLSLGTGNGAGFQAANTAATTSATSLGISSIDYSGSTTGVYSGTSVGTTSANGYTSPFGAGSNANYFGVEPGGSITLTFSTAQTMFALLIGTIDSYNIVTFTSATGSTQSFGGAQIAASAGGNSVGFTTENVMFSDLNPFTTVTLSDIQFSAFEFVPDPNPTAVPEPASLALLALPMGAVGLIVARRRRVGEG